MEDRHVAFTAQSAVNATWRVAREIYTFAKFIDIINQESFNRRRGQVETSYGDHQWHLLVPVARFFRGHQETLERTEQLKIMIFMEHRNLRRSMNALPFR